MKKNLFIVGLMLIALVSFSQENIKYTVKLESIYEIEFGVESEPEGSEIVIEIYNGQVFTHVNSLAFGYSKFTDSIVSVSTVYFCFEFKQYYRLFNGYFSSSMIISGDEILIQYDIDPKMLYIYKILDYEILQ